MTTSIFKVQYETLVSKVYEIVLKSTSNIIGEHINFSIGLLMEEHAKLMQDYKDYIDFDNTKKIEAGINYLNNIKDNVSEIIESEKEWVVVTERENKYE